MTLLTDQSGGGTTQVHGRSAGNSSEYLVSRGPLKLTFQDLLDVACQRLPSRFRTPRQLSVHPVRYMPDLNHPRHTGNLSHVHHMCNDRLEIEKGQPERRRLTVGAGAPHPTRPAGPQSGDGSELVARDHEFAAGASVNTRQGLHRSGTYEA